MSSRYGDIIKKARKEESQKTSEESVEESVNLCVKVPRSLRQHWAAEAKRSGTSMTEIIVEALTNRFGTPEE